MSTNINITVGDNALLDRAKEQQIANRQAQLQKEATLRLEAEATAARTAALANQGRDADGNLIIGAPFTQPQIDRRPAANRKPPDYYVAELRNVFVGKTQSGNVNINIIIEDGSEFNFNLASTFSYPDTDKVSSGIGAFQLNDYVITYDPPGIDAYPDYAFYQNKDTSDVFNPPSFGLNFSSISTSETAETVDSSNAMSYFAILLPVDKDACIVLTIGKGVRYRATAKVVRTISHSYVEYLNFENVTKWRHDYFDDYISEVSELQADSYQWVKCFYTNKTSCREISAPPTLYALLQDYLDSLSVSISWTYDTNLYVQGRDADGEILGIYDNKLLGGSWARIQTFAPYFTDKIKLYTLFASNSTATTPGVYKAIQLDSDDSRFSNPYDDKLNDVSYMVNQFYNGSYANLAKFGIQTTFAFLPEYAPKYYRHDRTRNRPTYNGPLSGPDLNQLIINPKVRTRNTNWLAWDWNNPGYCRQQLLALGFAPADLTPPP